MNPNTLGTSSPKPANISTRSFLENLQHVEQDLTSIAGPVHVNVYPNFLMAYTEQV